MSCGSRRQTNVNLRSRLDDLIGSVKKGKDIRTADIMKRIQEQDRRPALTLRRMSSLIKDRNDVQWIDTNLYRKV